MVSVRKVRVRMLNRRMLVLMGVAGSGKHRSRVIMDVVAIEFTIDMRMKFLRNNCLYCANDLVILKAVGKLISRKRTAAHMQDAPYLVMR